MDTIPDAWSRLTALTSLELRGHQLLDVLPPWLTGMSALRKLDVSGNAAISLSLVPQLTQLRVLVLQASACAGGGGAWCVAWRCCGSAAWWWWARGLGRGPG